MNLSEKYIQNRFLPDKAIDLIDEACSKINLEKLNKPEHLKEMESNLEKVKIEKKEAITAQEFFKAAKIKEGEIKLKEEFIGEENKWNDEKIKEVYELKKEDVENIVSRNLGIPINKLDDNEKNKILNLEENIKKEIIGQDEAINRVSSVIKRNFVKVINKQRPIGSFLFLGPTGVGKTELAKVISKNLFEFKDSLIRFDMSEYMDKIDSSKLIGSPPGYVGFDEGGILVDKVRKRPYSIILFDEIEKAHPDIMNILLQILEEGEITDSQGRKAYFKNTIIILTSNIGADKIVNKKNLGFNKNLESGSEIIKNDLYKELKYEIKPEILNRIDDIIIFNILTDEDIKNIIRKELNILISEFNKEDYKFIYNENIVEFLFLKINNIKGNSVSNKKEELIGGREVRKVVQNYIENLFAENILENKINKSEEYMIDVLNDKVCIK